MSETETIDFPGLTLRVADGVGRLTIDHPPMNVMNPALLFGMIEAVAAIDDHPDIRVLVVDSADPEFWIAHFDVGTILAMSTDLPADGAAPDSAAPETTRSDGAPSDNVFHALVERLRTMDTVTIAQIDGFVRGGGAEIAASMDMRFASDRSVLGQPEVPLGILPGGSGTQRLGELVGRGRAMEIVLGGADIDATTAASWGWVNRALPAEELPEFVDALAVRIASFPNLAVTEAKASVLRGVADPTAALVAESQAFTRTLSDPRAVARMRQFLQRGGQTREGERDLDAVLGQLDG